MINTRNSCLIFNVVSSLLISKTTASNQEVTFLLKGNAKKIRYSVCKNGMCSIYRRLKQRTWTLKCVCVCVSIYIYRMILAIIEKRDMLERQKESLYLLQGHTLSIHHVCLLQLSSCTVLWRVHEVYLTPVLQDNDFR